MAKILFENKFILTKQLHRQYCEECFTKMRKQTKLMALIFAMVFAAISCLVRFVLHWNKLAILFYVLTAYFVLWIFWGYKVSEWLNYRNLQRNHGQYIVMQISFEPTQVKVKTGETSLSFKYTTISKAYETKDLIILILSTEGMIEHGQVLFKNGFMGDQDGKCLNEFKKMINEKSQKDIFSLDTEDENSDK